MIPSYELMVLVSADSDMTTDKKQTELVRKMVGADVTISSVVSLGKKALAYPINKQTEATYLVAELTGKPIKMGDIQSQAKVMDNVVRFMLSVK